jgi:hypothetical protein
MMCSLASTKWVCTCQACCFPFPCVKQSSQRPRRAAAAKASYNFGGDSGDERDGDDPEGDDEDEDGVRLGSQRPPAGLGGAITVRWVGGWGIELSLHVTQRAVMGKGAMCPHQWEEA